MPEATYGTRGGCASCEGRIDRRAFITQGMLTAAGLALAACSGAGMLAGGSVGGAVSLSLKVGDNPALASTGGVLPVTSNGVPLAIVRTGQASFLALSRICPHQGTVIDLVSGGGFHCPRHGAQFDASGKWTGGQITSDLFAYPASYVAATDILTVG